LVKAVIDGRNLRDPHYGATICRPIHVMVRNEPLSTEGIQNDVQIGGP